MAQYEQAARRALEALDVVTAVERAPAGERLPDLRIRLADGRVLAVEVKGFSKPSSEQLAAYAHTAATPQDRVVIVVGDELPAAGRSAIAAAGLSYLDRRGQFLLQAPGVLIEREVDPQPRVPKARPARTVRGESGVTVALAALLEPSDPPGVRETARMSGLSHTAISNARRQLREAALLDRSHRPLLPELFWEVVGVWTPERLEIPPIPSAELRASDRPYQIGLEGPFHRDLSALAEAVKGGSAGSPAHDIGVPERLDGWALTGDHAAAAYGAPVVSGHRAPRDVLVPGDVWERVAARARDEGHGEHLGLHDRPRLRAAPTPTRLVTRLRHPNPGNGLPLAHPLVVAVELGRDEGRGREILQGFAPRGAARVWQ